MIDRKEFGDNFRAVKAILEKIRPAKDRSFATYEFALPRFDCPYHYHPEIELTLIVAGRGQRLIGDHLAPFEPGDLVLLGANLPHSYFHPPDFDDGPRGAHSIVAQFLPGMAGGLLAAAPECHALRRLLDRAGRGLVFRGRLRSEVGSLMRQLPGATGLERLILLLEMLRRLARDGTAEPLASAGFHPAFNQRQARRIERVCEWLTLHFREPVSLGAAARIASLTPAAFSRLFHRATNRPFVRFLNELRVGHACRLLLETDRPIAEIAFESGFENLSNFNRRFRELKHTAPRDFRQAATMAEKSGSIAGLGSRASRAFVSKSSGS